MASAYDKASLVMLPHAYKDDKLYSVKPEDRSGDFTFSRDGAGASPATRVNASGLIEKGRENLLLQSNQFDTTWGNSNSTETGGQAGYDGSSDAWLLTSTASGGAIGQAVSNSGVQTFSVYAKGGSLNWMAFTISGISPSQAYFDLQNGALGSVGSAVIKSNIESVGGDWYRCSILVNGAATGVNIYPANANNSVSVLGSIYIQDAQLESGLVATDYIETTTAPVSAGLLGDMPRLDYSGGATCGSLLLEPSRVNSVVQSEYFNSWTALNDVSITANNTTSPEGVLNGSLMSASGTGSTSRNVRLGSMPTSADAKSLSIFAKANATNYIQLFHSGDAEGYVNFDLSSGAVGTSGSKSTGDIEPMGNGWYRCVANFDNTNSFGSSIYVGFATSSSASYGGGAVADTSSVYIYGAQYENTASYPTSYIPTYGSAAPRAADDCEKSGITSLIGQTEGTFFVDLDNVNQLDSPEITLDDGTNNNRIVLTRSFSGYWSLFTASAGSGGSTFSTTISNSGKFAIAYNATNYVVYKDGALLLTRTASLPVSLTDFRLNGRATDDFYGNKTIKQALLFKTRLTNAELAALTA